MSIDIYATKSFLPAASSSALYVNIRIVNLPHPIPGPEVIKPFSCSTQLRLKFILLINVKMPTTVGILTFISRINYRLWQS